jgi:hypothetical protein
VSMVVASEAALAGDQPPVAQEARAPREPRAPRAPREPREAREQREPRPPREMRAAAEPEQAAPVPLATPVPDSGEVHVPAIEVRAVEPPVPSVHVSETRQAQFPLESAPVPIPPVEHVRAAPPQHRPEPPLALTLPPESGLELVETRHAAPVVVDEMETPRPKRVRPTRPVVASEPLEIIETRKDSPPPVN